MRQKQLMQGFIALLTVSTCSASPVEGPVNQRPCQQIRAACQAAGFVRGKGKEGYGLARDCVRPTMQCTPQRPKATKPLPQIDIQLIAACKAANPNCGKPKHLQP